MNKVLGIIGGDLRIVNLLKLYAEQSYTLYTYGLEKAEVYNEHIIKCSSIKEVVDNCKTVVGPIPFSNDDKTILSPFSNNPIYIEDIAKVLNNNNVFIAGKLNIAIKDMFSRINVTFIDILEREELTVLNAVATVEGSIEVAMKNTVITLHESNCLVLGFGRIGKILSKSLDGLGANVYCEARKNSDISWIRAYGYNPIKLDELDVNLNKFDIIFNTIPYMILDETRLKLLKEDCLIVDLSSKPGGVEFEKAKQLNVNVIWALAIPGKVAPLTASKYIKDTLDNIKYELQI